MCQEQSKTHSVFLLAGFLLIETGEGGGVQAGPTVQNIDFQLVFIPGTLEYQGFR